MGDIEIKHIDMKEDILRALEGKRILLCPECKNRVFIRKSYSRVEITEDDDGLLDNMIDGFEKYEYICAKCGMNLDVDEMIKTTKLVFNGED